MPCGVVEELFGGGEGGVQLFFGGSGAGADGLGAGREVRG
jgi:hypothetical protein